ncbi:MAG TPA: LON peptidase substrate-binding domain-containing protein [Ktedonobacterales bacterium]
MAVDLVEIPLFPLGLVLFPGMVQPLHIFEPRYREMTKRSLDTSGTFGIALALPEGSFHHEAPARIGCIARILDYHRLPDGRYNLLAVGARRFEIIELMRDQPYLRALARILPEVVGDGPVQALSEEARRLLDDYLAIVLADSEEGTSGITIPTDPIELSYFIAVLVPCDDSDKQELLEATTAVERLRRGLACMRSEIASAREAQTSETPRENGEERPTSGSSSDDERRPSSYLHRA